MWELDYKESWVLKNWCFWAVVLEKTLESPLDCKVIKPINPKGKQFTKFIGRTDVEAEAPILWPPDEKKWLIGKDPDIGKYWRQEEEGTTEDEVAGWHYWLMDMSLSKHQELVMDREASSTSVHRVAKSWTWLSDWTELKKVNHQFIFFFKIEKIEEKILVRNIKKGLFLRAVHSAHLSISSLYHLQRESVAHMDKIFSFSLLHTSI